MLNRAALILMLVLSLAAVPAFAQDASPDAPREIYTVLSYGDGVFSPDGWLATAYEQFDRATAYWTATDISAVAHVDLIHFDYGFSVGEALRFFGADLQGWLDVVLSNYQPWQIRARCGVGDLMLLEIEGEFQGEPKLIRYWFQPTSYTRLLTVQLIFPAQNRDLLDRYAAQMFPHLPECG